MKISIKCMLLGLLLSMAGSLAAVPVLSSGFTYQGSLDDGGSPANGFYDLRLSLHNAPSFGSIIAGPVVNSSVYVTNGLFSTVVDLGPGVFDGLPYWLEIEVRPAGGGGYTPLNPRQEITATPYALHAITAGLAGGVVGGVNDADANPANELNTGLGLDGTNLQLTDAGGTLWANLSSLINDADPDPSNELITGVLLTGTTLRVTDAGGPWDTDLSPLISDDDWSYFFGTGLSGDIYHSGDVALGAYTDPEGHGLNVQNYLSGHAAVRGADQSGSSLYAEGMLGVLAPFASPINFPISMSNIGVFGIKPNNGGNGAAVVGWNKDGNAINYASIFLAEGTNTGQNIAIYAEAKNGGDNLAALLKGNVIVENSFLEVTGNANEQAYIGGDGAGNDVQIGSLNSNVTTVATWNEESSTRMDFIASNIWATGDANVYGTAVVSEDVWVSGNERVEGLIRLGSETNAASAQYPAGPGGLVIRRIYSNSTATSNVLARTDGLVLERDGTTAGLQVSWSASVGQGVINAMGITQSGALVAFHHVISYPGTAGNITVFSDIQAVSHYDISFGDPYYASGGHITHVLLEREDGDYFMIGTVTSTYNQ
jgi:hypothetical protein